MMAGARQSYQFFIQNIWFLENNRALLKFLYGIWHYLVSIIKLQKQSFRGAFIKNVLKICSKFTGEHPCRSAISRTPLLGCL